MSKLHKFLTVIRNVNRAYTLVIEQDARTAKRIAMLQELKEVGLALTCAKALLYLSDAITLGRKYDIRLGEGYTFSTCKASLPKSSWTHPIDPSVDPSAYGVLSYFLITEVQDIIDETESIDAYADSVQEAIVQCLIYARRAGVI